MAEHTGGQVLVAEMNLKTMPLSRIGGSATDFDGMHAAQKLKYQNIHQNINTYTYTITEAG